MKINKITEIFNRFIRSVNDLEPIDNTIFSLEEFKRKISFAALDIDQLEQDFQNKSLQFSEENAEAHSFFATKLNSNEQTLHKELTLLAKNLEDEKKRFDEELEKIKRNNINQFKNHEQAFISKANFLKNNKKNNKDEYINNVRAINEKRINANHNYQQISDDLDNKNEQTNYDFNHAVERYYANHEINKANIINEYKDKLISIDEKYDFDIENTYKNITNYKRQIVDGTIKLNSDITDLEVESQRRIRYGYVPFDLETNQVNDEHDNKIQEYAQTSEQILSEFQLHLQKIDNRIQNLRKEQRSNDFECKQKIERLRLEHNNQTNRIINEFNVKLNQLNNILRKDHDDEIEQQIKTLNVEKSKYIKARKKLLTEQEFAIKKSHVEIELKYIEQFELLRCEKNKYEAIKSNAMKNLNAQKDIHMTEMNIKLQSITNNKESFVQIEQVEENKKIIQLRLNRDIENSNIEFQIYELERELKHIEFLRKIDKQRLKLEQQTQLESLEINLKYQNKVLENRRNFSNISKMLEIQKNGIIRDFMNVSAYQEIDYELHRYNFYNECDNLQYKIYKLDYDYQSKLLDEESKVALKISEIKKLSVDGLNIHEEKMIHNFSLYRECMERINFYKERFEIEKKMILSIRNLFQATLKIIFQIEGSLLSLLTKVSPIYIYRNLVIILSLFDNIRDMKLDSLTKLFSNEVKVITTRIDFDKDLKYSRVIKALNKEKDSYLKQLFDRYDKIEETINNYNSTIKVFEGNIAKLKVEELNMFHEIRNLFKISGKERKVELLSLKKKIYENDTKIKNYKLQIKNNRSNINTLLNSEISIKNEIKKTNLRYKKQFDNIIKSQSDDAKIYNKTITAMKRQYNKLKNACIRQYYSPVIEKNISNNIELFINKLESANQKLIDMSKTYSDFNTSSFESAVSQELNSLNSNYINSYERNDNQIYTAKLNDSDNYKNRIAEIVKEHNVQANILKKDYDDELKKLYTDLNNINEEFLQLTRKYENSMKIARLRHINNVKCQQANFQNYEENYIHNTKQYRTIFQKENRANKLKHKKQLEELEQNIAAYEKKDIARTNSNILITKNQINDLKNDYHLNLQKYNLQLKEISKKGHILQNETNKSIRNNLEINNKNQKANRQEFESQLKIIENRSKQRIIENQRKYLKKMQKNKRD